MFNSVPKDEEAEVVVPAVATADDKDDGGDTKPKKSCCTIAMEIVQVSLMALFSLFILCFSIMWFQIYDYTVISIDQPAGLLIFGAMCFMGAASLDIVLRVKEGGCANITFGALGLASALFWFVTGVLYIVKIYNELNGNVHAAMIMLSSGLHLSTVIYDMIQKKEQGCNGILSLIASIFLIVGNAMFLGSAAYLFYIANNDYFGTTYDDNWFNDNFDDYWDRNRELLGLYYASPAADDLKNAFGLMVGGSLSYVVASILDIVKISMRCCK